VLRHPLCLHLGLLPLSQLFAICDFISRFSSFLFYIASALVCVSTIELYLYGPSGGMM